MPTTQPPTTPPPTTTTTTTTPAPSACPCENGVDTVFAAINTAYFSNALNGGDTRFILPCQWITLSKNLEKNCTYESVEQVNLSFYNKPKSFNGEDTTTVTISATLTYDDEINVWDFTWQTDSLIDSDPNPIFSLTYYSNTVTEENCNIFSNYQLALSGSALSGTDEVVCVREEPEINDFVIDDIIGIKINYDNNNLFRCNELQLILPALNAPMLIYGSPHMYIVFEESPDDLYGNNNKAKAVTFEMFINQCTNKKFFKVFDTFLSNNDYKFYYYIQDGNESNTFYPDGPNEVNGQFSSIELGSDFENCNKCGSHDDILTSEKEIRQKIDSLFRLGSFNDKDTPNMIPAVEYYVVDDMTNINNTIGKFSLVPLTNPTDGVFFSSNPRKNLFDPEMKENDNWIIFRKIGVSYGFIDSDSVENSLEDALDIVKDLSDQFKYGEFQTIADSNFNGNIGYFPLMQSDIIVKDEDDLYTFNVYKILENNDETKNFVTYEGNIIKYSDDCYGFKIYWYLNISSRPILEELKKIGKRRKKVRIPIEEEGDDPPDPFAVIDKFINDEFIFDAIDGEIATIEIDGNEFIVKNDDNQLVFDFEGDQEHTFTSINESVTIVINDLSYEVTFDGYGSLLFSIKTIIPELDYFDNYITSSNTGIIITDPLSRNIEIGVNLIDDGDLDDKKMTYDVLGVKLEIDTAYKGQIFSVLFKDSDIVVYLNVDNVGYNNIIAYDIISNTEPKYCGVTLTDHTKVPNSLPQTTSSNGVEIEDLLDGYTGISFDPIDDSELNNVSVEVTVEGNTFLIDSAYNGRTFVLNELRTPTNSQSTVFTFYSDRDYGVNVFRTSKVINGEFLRMRLLGYF